MNDEHSRPKASSPPPQGTDVGSQAGVPSSGTENTSVAWEALAAGRRTVVIHFKGMTYQLRETRNGKLILTK